MAELYATLARDALIRYATYNLQPLSLAERLADSFAHHAGVSNP
jgi:hypothetical protein